MWKVRILLIRDRIKNLFKKKKPQPRFASPLYQLRKEPVKTPAKNRAGVVLWAFLRECGVVAYGDLKWLITRRKQSVEESWTYAAEQVRKGR